MQQTWHNTDDVGHPIDAVTQGDYGAKDTIFASIRDGPSSAPEKRVLSRLSISNETGSVLCTRT